MKQGLINIEWDIAGALLAQSDDNDQAKFIKAFLRECSTWGSRLQVEKQLAAVNHLLTDDEKEALAMLSFKE